MSETKTKIEKTKIYSNEKGFSVSTYDFIIPKWDKKWETIKLVELETKKNKWNEELKQEVIVRNYITISQEVLNWFINDIVSKSKKD